MSEVRKVKSNIKLENTKLMFKNFSGKKTDMNKEGDRNFCAVVDPETAEVLKRDGWNIKSYIPKNNNPDNLEVFYIKVKVKFGDYPPVIVLINNSGKIRLDEELVDQLDWSRIRSADLIISPYNYPAMPNRPAGVAAYLKALYVTVEEDDLEEKYADIPWREYTHDDEEMPFK